MVYIFGVIAVIALGAVRYIVLNQPINTIAKRFSQISASSYHTLAVSSQGKVYAWGWNGNGQVGTGTTTDTAVPTLVQVADTPMEGKTITQVSAGGHFDFGHSAALASDGMVYTWGANDYGQLGDGTNTRALKPVKVALPAGTVCDEGGDWTGIFSGIDRE